MKNLSRRSFIKSASAAATGAIIIPNFLRCSPGNRLNIAVIGVGGRGEASWTQVPESSLELCAQSPSSKQGTLVN